MKNYIPVLLLSFLIIGCEQSIEIDPDFILDLKDCFSPELGITEDEQFFFDYTNGVIEIDGNNNPAYSLKNGSSLVFVYRHIFENKLNVIDDEFEERVLFQIDNDLESFIIDESDEFEKSNCIYGACGGSFPKVSFLTNEGSISGEKINESEWNISLNIVVEKFNGILDTIQSEKRYRIK